MKKKDDMNTGTGDQNVTPFACRLGPVMAGGVASNDAFNIYQGAYCDMLVDLIKKYGIDVNGVRYIQNEPDLEIAIYKWLKGKNIKCDESVCLEEHILNILYQIMDECRIKYEDIYDKFSEMLNNRQMP